MSDLLLLRERVGVRVNQFIGQLLRVSGGAQPSSQSRLKWQDDFHGRQ